jgi:hypothetical protein
MAMGGWYWLRCSPYFRVFNPEIQLKKFDEKEDISVSGSEFEMGYGALWLSTLLREIEQSKRIKLEY